MNTLQATHIKTFKSKLSIGLLLLFCAPYFFAQNKLLKFEQEFSLNTIPEFKLNSSHSNIIISTWEKKAIKILAYSEGEVEQQSLEKTNDLWEITIQQSDSLFFIETDASKQLPQKVITNYNSNDSNSFTDSTSVLLTSMINPLLSNLKNNTMPKVLRERINESKFNFDAYRSLGETYFKMWEYNLVKNLDNASIEEIRNWYSQMSTNLINVSNTNKNINTQDKILYRFYESRTVPVNTIKKVIELKIPRESIPELNTRFGTVTINNIIKNLKATLKYTAFDATDVDGGETNISISSAPVEIKKWNNGLLQLKYVKNSSIDLVANIRLNAVSSRLVISELKGVGEFKSTFSQLVIDKTGTNFNSLSFLNTNSDLVLSLPNQAYNFVYSGEMSGIKIPPNKLELKSLGDYRKLMLHGYSVSRNTDKEIQMNMVNSQILLK